MSRVKSFGDTSGVLAAADDPNRGQGEGDEGLRQPLFPQKGESKMAVAARGERK
jgi:hypothetical protein